MRHNHVGGTAAAATTASTGRQSLNEPTKLDEPRNLPVGYITTIRRSERAQAKRRFDAVPGWNGLRLFNRLS